jgi:uncharacterized protein (DUF2267 family)
VPPREQSASDGRHQVVDYETFLTIVAQHGANGRAGRASRAVLQTLGERIDREEARQLAAQLPPELAPWIATTSPAERFDADEFVRRAARREAVAPEVARRDASAVFDALGRTVSDDEWQDLVAELPKSFAPMLPRGHHVDVVNGEKFVQRVARRAKIDEKAAWRAAEATLRTLAERIAGGEVDDLVVHTPPELHAPLKRGRAATAGQALPLQLERFVQRIAEREGVSPQEAVAHTRAVFSVLRETVGDEEFFDVVVQLPEDYVRALGLGLRDAGRRPV